MLLRVRWRGETLELRLTPDSDGTRPALARAAGHALSYRGEPRGELRDVPGLGERFARSDGTAEAALRAAIEAHWPGASVEEVAGDLPRWPSTLRIGDPRPDAIWPFDAEMVGLTLGLRRLLKREQFSEVAAVRDAAWLRGQGLAVSEPGPPDADGRRVIFAGRDEAALTEAEALEAQLRRADGSSEEAGRRLGEALGYPACCVDAYARVEARDDRGLAEALLPQPGAPPASPLTQWLNAPLGIVSHAPCSLSCERTLALAAALLDGLEARSAGFGARWRDLAARVQVVDENRALALDVREGVVRRATELRVPTGESLEELARDASELVGEPLVAVASSGALLADHRGE